MGKYWLALLVVLSMSCSGEAHQRRMAGMRAAYRSGAVQMPDFRPGMARTPAKRTYGATAAVSEPECRSDYDCGYGNVCVKAQYHYTGKCAVAVNEYGSKTYQPPAPSSYGSGTQGTCAKTGCPPGFACDYRTGKCWK